MKIQGTHKGEWCGAAGTGRWIQFHVCVLYLFEKGDSSGKLLVERIYFDNETVMKQISGQVDASNVREFGDRREVAEAK
jgi:hypothetical protein